MTQMTFIAANDMEIQCEQGSLEFKKGDAVHLEVDIDDNPYLTVYEADETGLVHLIEVDITTIDTFNALMENLELLEEEYDDKVSFEEMNIDQLLENENVSLDSLTCYLAEQSYRKKRVVRKGKVTRIKVPVRRRKKRMTAKQRAARIKQVRKLARSPKARRNRMKSLKIRRRKMRESATLVDKFLLLNDSLPVAASCAKEILESYFNDRAEVKLTSKNQIIVKLMDATEEDFQEAMNLAEVNFKVEGTDLNKVVTLEIPMSDPVVESYYSEVEEAVDCMKKAESMLSKMKEKMKEMEETDMDMEEVNKAMESYKAKMKKMKEMEDGEEKETLLSEMEGDYHTFIKMIDNPAN